MVRMFLKAISILIITVIISFYTMIIMNIILLLMPIYNFIEFLIYQQFVGKIKMEFKKYDKDLKEVK